MSLIERSFPGSDCAVVVSHEVSRIPSQEMTPLHSLYQVLAERNIHVKKSMSCELIAMGLSPEAIARILYLDQD